MYYLYLTGQQVKPQLEQKDGINWIYEVRYFLTFLKKRKRGEMTFRDFWKGFKGKKSTLFLLGMTRCHLSETLGLISKTAGNGSGRKIGMYEKDLLYGVFQKLRIDEKLSYSFGERAAVNPDDITCLKSTDRSAIYKLFVKKNPALCR